MSPGRGNAGEPTGPGDDARRLNENRFTETASRYAASRAIARVRTTQNEAVFRLAAPGYENRELDVTCGPGALLAWI